jgi:hypothetical protein
MQGCYSPPHEVYECVNCVTDFRVMSDCHSHSHCSVGTSSLYQTLDELDFERGIWYAGKLHWEGGTLSTF